MAKILLNNITVHAFHGCMEEEKLSGNDYSINLEISTNIKKASKTDDINHALNYVDLYDIVISQMQIRSNLIENVAHRIVNKIEENHANYIKKITVKVSKIHPPIKGNLESVSVVLTKKIKKKN